VWASCDGLSLLGAHGDTARVLRLNQPRSCKTRSSAGSIAWPIAGWCPLRSTSLVRLPTCMAAVPWKRVPEPVWKWNQTQI
jgi:hypothetical protein